jgi:hypothetical protein
VAWLKTIFWYIFDIIQKYSKWFCWLKFFRSSHFWNTSVFRNWKTHLIFPSSMAVGCLGCESKNQGHRLSRSRTAWSLERPVVSTPRFRDRCCAPLSQGYGGSSHYRSGREAAWCFSKLTKAFPAFVSHGEAYDILWHRDT